MKSQRAALAQLQVLSPAWHGAGLSRTGETRSFLKKGILALYDFWEFLRF